MKLTIITICLNIVDEIERTLKSVVSQTFSDFEWIVIDGGSTDGTVSLLFTYNYWINTLISEPDSGIYNAMNKGIKISKGEWLIFLNGGDEFYNDQVLERVFSLNISSGIIYGNHINSDGINRFTWNPVSKLNQRYFFDKTLPHQSSFFHREVFFKYHFLYDEKYRMMADWELFLKCYFSKQIKFSKINEVVSVFYFGGLSSNQLDIRRYEEKLVRIEYFSLFRRCLYNFLIMYKNGQVRMVLTHPRYVGGYLKQTILKKFK